MAHHSDVISLDSLVSETIRLLTSDTGETRRLQATNAARQILERTDLSARDCMSLFTLVRAHYFTEEGGDEEWVKFTKKALVEFLAKVVPDTMGDDYQQLINRRFHTTPPE
jgi:hypothetical protein